MSFIYDLNPQKNLTVVVELPNNVLTESADYVHVKLLKAPEPNSPLDFEVTEELIPNDTLFETLLNAEESTEITPALSRLFDGNSEVIRSRLFGHLTGSNAGNRLVTKIDFKHKNVTFPIEILIYQSNNKMVAVVVGEKMLEEVSLHDFPIENLVKIAIEAKKAKNVDSLRRYA